MADAETKSQKTAWWPLAASYLLAWGFYVFAQPPLVRNPSPDDILQGRLVGFFTFGMLLLTGFVAGCIGGLIFKSKGRPFPWRRILWASLVIAGAFAVF